MAIKPIEIIIRAKDEASSIFGAMQTKVAAVGAAIAAYFGINAFADAVKGAADLEEALSQVKAVSGASADEMVKLRAAAEAAGANTKYTATEAATALGNLARAGLTAQQAIEALPATLQLAQAGGIDLAAASEYLTKAVTGMGGSFADSGRYADVLAMGANASNTSVTGLAQALSYAAPTAKTLGLTLEDTVAIIGKFADSGIDASRAGTALNGILSQFSDPASTFKKALSDIGITTTDFNSALGQLAEAGPRGQKAIAAVGLEAGPALKALLGSGIGALDELRTKLLNAQGSAEATAATMGNNLNGSIKGLGSAWDTLKNALATPVLPVLKDGVDKLATSFREAVDSGVVAKFGAAIGTGFESAITWAQAFAREVDFAALATTLRGYATQAGEAFAEIKNAATTAGDVVRLVWGTMSAGGNAVMTGVYLVGEAFAGVANDVQEALAFMYDGLSKITFGSLSESYKAAAESVRESAAATDAVTQAMAAKAAASLQAMADGAQTARNGWQGLTTDAQSADVQMGTSQAVIAATAAELKAMGGDAEAAGQRAATAATAHTAAAEAAKAKVAELRAEYQAAVDAGNWQLAAEKITALKAATDAARTGVAGLKAEADASAAAIAAAFAGMGIKTKAELTDMANTAATRFGLIKSSGQATADGLATAWKAMAEAAIAANGGVATETLKSEASMYKLQITTDATGKSIVNAMGSGAQATQGFTGTVNDARTALERLNDERERGIAAQEKANDLKEREKALTDAHYNRDKEGFGLNTAGERAVGGGMSLNEAVKQAVAQGLSESDAYRIANQNYTQGKTVRMAGANFDIPGAINGSNFWSDVTKQLDSNLARKAIGGFESGTSTAATTPGTTAAKTYNVQIGGSTARFDSDAQAKAFISELNKAKLTA